MAYLSSHKIKDMASFRIRPKFETTSPLTIEEIIEKVKEKLNDNMHHLNGQAMQDHITIRVNPNQQHFWSPQLSVLMTREPEDSETKIIGVYGPMPNVWTIFALSYLALSVLFIFISIIAFSQRALGQDTALIYVLPLLILIALTMYISSQMGQKLGAPQTYAIHYFFEEVLGKPLPTI